MRKRSYQYEILMVVLSAAIIVLTVLLFLRSSELTILFPVVFGLAAVLSVLSALEGIAFNKNRVVSKRRAVIFGVLALLLLVLTVVALKVVL